MKLQYWGTAAAEGVPAIFCRCELCKEARKRGGRNLRGRPNALVDGVLKIDFNADTYAQSLRYGVDLTEIHHLLVTHTHSDHFYPNDSDIPPSGFERGAPYFRSPLMGHPRLDSWQRIW